MPAPVWPLPTPCTAAPPVSSAASRAASAMDGPDTNTAAAPAPPECTPTRGPTPTPPATAAAGRGELLWSKLPYVNREPAVVCAGGGVRDDTRRAPPGPCTTMLLPGPGPSLPALLLPPLPPLLAVLPLLLAVLPGGSCGAATAAAPTPTPPPPPPPAAEGTPRGATPMACLNAASAEAWSSPSVAATPCTAASTTSLLAAVTVAAAAARSASVAGCSSCVSPPPTASVAAA